MELVRTNTEALAILLALTDTGGALDGAEVRLYVNDVQPVVTSVVGDFDETTYTGHADKLITWLPPSIADDGSPECIGTVPEFRPTDDVTPNTVYGLIIIDSGGVMFEGGRFDDAPLPMESDLDSIVVTIRLRFLDNSIAVVIS